MPCLFKVFFTGACRLILPRADNGTSPLLSADPGRDDPARDMGLPEDVGGRDPLPIRGEFEPRLSRADKGRVLSETGCLELSRPVALSSLPSLGLYGFEEMEVWVFCRPSCCDSGRV